MKEKVNEMFDALVKENIELKVEISELKKYLKWIESISQGSFSKEMIDIIRK